MDRLSVSSFHGITGFYQVLVGDSLCGMVLLDSGLSDEYRQGLELYNNLCNKHDLV
jgi:hypothetical protein